ncbi:MAG: DciA family protein [Pusillimonas sp.]
MVRRAPRQSLDATPATLAVSWLGSDQHGAQVLMAARNLIAAEQAAKQALPPALAAVCKVARIERQHITLAVPGAAYAAKLRQVAPRVLQLLNGSGWNLNEISVKVQAGLGQNQTKSAPREVIPLDDAALEAFETLRSGLRPGPLADAVQRLLRHHQR